MPRKKQPPAARSAEGSGRAQTTKTSPRVEQALDVLASLGGEAVLAALLNPSTSPAEQPAKRSEA